MSRTGGMGQGMGGVDQRHMGKSLREIAEMAAPDGIVFLGQKPDIISQAEQPLEKLLGFVEPAAQHISVA